MYDYGRGVPQDYAEAAKWYRRAAEQGNANSQYNLGVMYAEGQGVSQDYVLAHLWLNLAVSRATKPDLQEPGTKMRNYLASQMTSAQIAEAQRLAREWKPKKGVK